MPEGKADVLAEYSGPELVWETEKDWVTTNGGVAATGEAMAYQYTCPCGQKYRIEDKTIGKSFVCPRCQRRNTLDQAALVPLAASEPAAPIPTSHSPVPEAVMGSKEILAKHAAGELSVAEAARLLDQIERNEPRAEVPGPARLLGQQPEKARLFDRAAAAVASGDFDKAIADFTEAIRLDPKEAVAYYKRGMAYGAKGDHDKAIADYTEAIRLNPKSAEAYINRGVVYAGKGEKAKAEADFDQTKKLGMGP